ncbi:hypothetical protein PISMIDRAFT_15167 [Pisolithus microcarpus 441]|uniref:ABC transporter domain-containing protein n=1 Tax=Pisolithus microcarpus 441 TaxID=765257 RepID=A0A0C9XY11_9AGAM|nr:hypothetical protein PISMIDRAFT_15167 [Pisolithus microcarpus 441]
MTILTGSFSSESRRDDPRSAGQGTLDGVMQNALDKASAGQTTIAIAHRLSTIMGANQISVMDESVILE